MRQKIKRILAILIAISFVVALTTTTVSAAPSPHAKVPTFDKPPVATPPVTTGQPPTTTPPFTAPPVPIPPVDIGI